jgi:type IV pilus assembly protein PilW
VQAFLRQAGHQRQRGFSLIELMVGVVIGMVAVIVVMQVLIVSDSSKRTGTSSDDAQTTGAIALTSLMRDIRQAGQGFTSPVRQGTTPAWFIGCNLTLPGGSTLAGIAPVTINHPAIPAGDANTDTLLVAYGNGTGSPDGDRVNAQSAATSYTVATPTSFAPSEQVVALPSPAPLPSATCAQTLVLSRIASVIGSDVSVQTGTAGMNGGTLFNLGTAPQVLAYAVRNGNLTVCDYTVNDCGDAGDAGNLATWVPIASNVVALRAQYGADTSAPAMDGIVDAYNQTTPTTACGWVRVPAIRLALVARAAQYDKDFDLSSQAQALASVTTWAGSAGAPINLTGVGDWSHYRYKKFETTVPLRNVAWLGAQPSC